MTAPHHGCIVVFRWHMPFLRHARLSRRRGWRPVLMLDGDVRCPLSVETRGPHDGVLDGKERCQSCLSPEALDGATVCVCFSTTRPASLLLQACRPGAYPVSLGTRRSRAGGQSVFASSCLTEFRRCSHIRTTLAGGWPNLTVPGHHGPSWANFSPTLPKWANPPCQNRATLYGSRPKSVELG